MQKSLTARTIARSTGQLSPFKQLQVHAETIKDKKVVLVVANVESDVQHHGFSDIASRCLPRASLLTISWPEFLRGLPTLDADVIFICGMKHGRSHFFDTLRAGLETFRSRNPKAVVAMANAHLERGTLHSLHSSNLIDHMEHHDVFSIPFLAKGVELFIARQELQ